MEAQEYWSRWPIPSPMDLPDPGIELGSPALQVHSLPGELPGNAISSVTLYNLFFSLFLPYCLTPLLDSKYPFPLMS